MMLCNLPGVLGCVECPQGQLDKIAGIYILAISMIFTLFVSRAMHQVLTAECRMPNAHSLGGEGFAPSIPRMECPKSGT